MAGVPFWILGVVLVVIGSLGNNYGNNLVSLGHKLRKNNGECTSCGVDDKHADDGNNNKEYNNTNMEKSLEDKIEAAVVDKPTELTDAEKRSHAFWRTFGIVVIVVANLATFAAFGFAAQSLLAALESVQFLSNVAFSKFVHHETVTRRTVFATCMIIVGNVLVVIFADKKAIILNSADILELYRTNSSYHAYLCCAFVIFVGFHFLYVHYYDARVKHGRKLWKHSFVEPFSYSISASIIGTQAVLNSKCMSMLIQSSARTSRNEFVRPTIWVILVTWIMFVAYWLRRLDKGLELFPPQFIIPVLQVFFVFFAILCGGIYFKEFETFNMVQYAGFVIGVVLILWGVYLLAPVDTGVTPVTGTEYTSADGVKYVAADGCDPENQMIALTVGDCPNDSKTNNGGCEMMENKKWNNTDILSSTANINAEDNSQSQSQPQGPATLKFDVMDPAELEIKKKRAIVKRPSNPVVGDDSSNNVLLGGTDTSSPSPLVV
jgi:hypothetical protein